MTSPPPVHFATQNAQNHRKARPSLIPADQTQNACLTVGESVGTEMDGIVAVLMRLYACYIEWYARSRGVEHHAQQVFGAALPGAFRRTHHNAVSLKARLFCTVPHEFRVAPRPFTPNGSTLAIKSVRVPGTNRTQHFVLYPGARRAVSLRTGTYVSAARFMERIAVAFNTPVIATKAIATCLAKIMNKVLQKQFNIPESSYTLLIPP